MQAVTIRDGELVVAEHPDPEPGAGEALVAVRGAGLNAGDLLQLKGSYPAPPGSPADIPGLEIAGEVVALGPGADRFVEGDRVMAIVGGGGQASLCAVHERQLMPVPGPVGWAQAGGLPEAFTTAHDALFSQAGLRAGERLLVSGAAGGVGTAAVQLAGAAGAQVVASVRDGALHEAVLALGASVACLPDESPGLGPYDVILELVGAPDLEANLASLATGGRIAVIGVGAGFKAEVNLLRLMGARGSICGSTLRARPLEEKALAAREMERSVLPLFESGRIEVPMQATFPLSEAPAAYELFAQPGKLGKIVLEPPA